MVRKTLKWFLRIVALLLVVVAIFLINLIWFRPWSLNLFYEKVFVQVLFEEPELLSSLGLVEQFGFTAHNGKLGDASPAHQQRYFDRAKQNLADLRAYSLDRQTPSQRLSTHILDWYIDRELEGEKYQWHNYPVNQLFGVQNEFPSFMANQHRLLAPRDCEYYLMRLNALPRKFDQLLESLRVREQKQILPPRFVVEKVLTEMNGFVAQPAAENILASSFKERAAKIKDLTDAQRTDFQKRVEDAVQYRVYPAYQKLIDYFSAILPKTTTDDGVWKMPEGEAYYTYALRKNTTTPLKPEEVHDLGLREVTRIESGDARHPRLERVRRPADRRGAGGAREAIRVSSSQTMTRAGRKRSRNTRVSLRRRWSAVSSCSRPCPRRRLKCGASRNSSRRPPPERIIREPSMDGTRPGVFYANLRDMSEISKWSMPTLAYHEGVPGHHFQISIAHELTGLPQFRKLIPFTAYQEGWALYTEWLAKEAGWYEGDPFGDLGRLQAELFRAVRLVVDTGIHAKRWPREQAITYMRDKTGMGEKEVTAEIERYIVNPGQACAYKVGMLKIQELRTRAQTELGSKFDQREFHDVVLKNGAMPLEILEEQVTAYIQRTKS